MQSKPGVYKGCSMTYCFIIALKKHLQFKLELLLERPSLGAIDLERSLVDVKTKDFEGPLDSPRSLRWNSLFRCSVARQGASS